LYRIVVLGILNIHIFDILRTRMIYRLFCSM